MPFNPKAYGSRVAEILALDQNGNRLIALVSGTCSSPEACALLKKHQASDLFPRAAAPEAALGGLWLYFSCWNEGHEIVQDVNSREGSLWHAILHRQEPDPGNAAYWFRQAGSHPTFRDLHVSAEAILEKHPGAGFEAGPRWDPMRFVEFTERARRQPGSASERAALEIQRAEWQLLFDYCARARS